MITAHARGRSIRTGAMAALALVLAGQSLPGMAQDSQSDAARIRKLEAEIRALQRQVFPGSDGKVFSPEITRQGTTPTATPGQPATTPVTDILVRLDSLEAQIARLTGQTEQNANKLAQIEAQLASSAPGAALSGATAPVPSAPVAATPAAPAASAPVTIATPASATPAAPSAPAVVAAPAPKPAPAKPKAPSAQRVAAVQAIVKPQTNDPGDDEYSYGFRLWEAKFYPEAQQQLLMMVDKYPRHARLSFARNLLGRAYLDDSNPREAAKWFVLNYNSNRAGERAADSLLYLAESMRQINDTKRACIALSEFTSTYPREATGRLKTQYDRTSAGVRCN